MPPGTLLFGEISPHESHPQGSKVADSLCFHLISDLGPDQTAHFGLAAFEQGGGGQVAQPTRNPCDQDFGFQGGAQTLDFLFGCNYIVTVTR